MYRRISVLLTLACLLVLAAAMFLMGTTSALAVETQGLWKWPAYKEPYSNMPSDYVYSIKTTAANEVWCASGGPEFNRGGASKFRHDIPDYEKETWTVCNSTSGHLPDSYTYSIDSDASGNIWAATAKGVSRFQGSSSPYWPNELQFRPCRHVAVNPNDGHIWVAKMAEFGDNAALYRYDGSTWTRYDGNPANPDYNPNGPQDWNITTIDFDSQGNVWIGASGGGLSKFDGATNWTHYTIANSPLPSPTVEDITFDNSGNAWIATSTQLGGSGGVWKFNPATYHPVNNPGTIYGPSTSGLQDTDVKCITISSIDGIWFGTRTQGAYLYNPAKPANKQWRVFNPQNTGEGLANSCVTGIAYDNSGYIWFSTLSGGVGRLTAESIRNQPPEASFKVQRAFGVVSETEFQFDASQSSDPEDPLGALQVRWDWDASDGLNWDTDWSPIKIAGHVFSQAGDLTVTLQVRDTEGLVDETRRTVNVGYDDTTEPSNPSSVTSPSHTLSTWSSDNTVDVNWSGAADASGIDGYSYEWSTSPASIPDTTKDCEENVTSATSPALADGNNHYFHIRTKDNAGNWNSDATHYGPFYIDRTQPSIEIINPLDQSTIAGIINVQVDALDAPSGIDRVDFYVDGFWKYTDDSIPFSYSWDTSVLGLPYGHTIQAVAYDGAGNNKSDTHIVFIRRSITPQESTTFYFAEGYTGAGFQEWLTVQNPNAESANVTIEYSYRGGGGTTQNVSVGPNTRETIDVNAAVGQGKEVSAKVTSDKAIIAERPMYFNFGGINGGHNVVGATSTNITWYFAEGYTGSGFQEYLTLQNPDSETANVTIEYSFRGGGGTTQNISVGPNTRETIDVNGAVGQGREVSAKVTSDKAIIAERPMYFNFQGINGGHNVVGANNPNTTFYFAEGYTGPGFLEYLTLQNPSSETANVAIEYTFRGGGGTSQDVSVPPNSRQTVEVNAAVGSREVSAKVTSDKAIIAERPMYFNFNGINGGHNVVGANNPNTTFYFAEGYTGSGFQEWLTLQNPNAESANVTIEYSYRGGGGSTQTLAIGPNTRQTVDVNGQVGSNKEVSAKVTSDKAIIAERPMYFNFGGIDGGHDVVGF